VYSQEDYKYELPAELIAQIPAKKRDESRMMVLSREKGSIEHSSISALEGFLAPGDLIVLNDTQVVPARLLGRKESGGRVEVLVLNPATEQSPYRCLLKAGKPPKPGTFLLFGNGIRAKVYDPVVEGQTRIEFLGSRTLIEILEDVGCVPLPPYIRRNGSPGKLDDARAYQTIYACRPGAIAAPTAGLHFSEPLLNRLRQKGIILVSLTLHVGYGTFQPVRERDIRNHRLQEEFYDIPAETALAVNRAKAKGARVVAVGEV
jgi:S-adenosylmethionine:tRNA ribosyltransferase-isomerase